MKRSCKDLPGCILVPGDKFHKCMDKRQQEGEGVQFELAHACCACTSLSGLLCAWLTPHHDECPIKQRASIRAKGTAVQSEQYYTMDRVIAPCKRPVLLPQVPLIQQVFLCGRQGKRQLAGLAKHLYKD
eukprot:1150263-Pelagomonas_calceolata.AAC.4